MPIVITGADGFIGKNLRLRLAELGHVNVVGITRATPLHAVQQALAEADFVFHLGGVNRPQDPAEFAAGNVGLTQTVCDALAATARRVPLLLASSTQAALGNPYGRSKLAAEEAVRGYGAATGAPVHIFRLPNVFGKWCKPNYNSAVATFCHNIARGLEVTIADPNRIVELVYIDDVVRSFTAMLDEHLESGTRHIEVQPVTKITLKDLVQELLRIRDVRTELLLPDLSDRFRKNLYATYLSFLPTQSFAYDLKRHEDSRGALAELLKSPHFGQIFVSRTTPGSVRGNHFHNSKVEKFCVLEGEAVIRFRQITHDEVLSYHVHGGEFRVVDIPPGYTHTIENVGVRDLIVLFWSSEIFDAQMSDTYAHPVQKP